MLLYLIMFNKTQTSKQELQLNLPLKTSKISQLDQPKAQLNYSKKIAPNENENIYSLYTLFKY